MELWLGAARAWLISMVVNHLDGGKNKFITIHTCTVYNIIYIYTTTNGHFSTGMHIQVRTCVWQVLSTCIFVCICPMRLHWESFGCHQDLLTLDAEAKWSPKLHGFCFEAFTPNKLTLSGHEIGSGQPKQTQPHYLFRMSSGVLFLLHVAQEYASCFKFKSAGHQRWHAQYFEPLK